MATNTARFALQTLDDSQSQADITYNGSLWQIDQCINAASVKNRTTSTPPGSPAVGDCYLVNTGGTGAWSGKDGQIAFWAPFNGTNQWNFIVVQAGMFIWDSNAGDLRVWTGSTYKTVTLV